MSSSCPKYDASDVPDGRHLGGSEVNAAAAGNSGEGDRQFVPAAEGPDEKRQRSKPSSDSLLSPALRGFESPSRREGPAGPAATFSWTPLLLFGLGLGRFDLDRGRVHAVLDRDFVAHLQTGGNLRRPVAGELPPVLTLLDHDHVAVDLEHRSRHLVGPGRRSEYHRRKEQAAHERRHDRKSLHLHSSFTARFYRRRRRPVVQSARNVAVESAETAVFGRPMTPTTRTKTSWGSPPAASGGCG